MTHTVAQFGTYHTYTFGPGRFEDLKLRVYRRVRRDTDHIVAKCVGSFKVYCGAGNTHTVSINEEMHGLMGAPQEFDQMMQRAVSGPGNEDTAYELVEQLVEWALQDWSDPCEEDES